MLNVQDIKELIKEFDSSSLSELSFSEGKTKLKFKKNNVSISEVNNQTLSYPAVASHTLPKQTDIIESLPNDNGVGLSQTIQENKNVVSSKEETLLEIISPMIGTFYSSSAPESPLYVNIGDRVDDGTTVCIVEAMKLFNEIESEFTGEIVEVLVQNGQLVEYGQPLFRVRP